MFGETADQVVIANTKGFTGHAMGAGVEDVLAVKALETGCVPPVANYKEVDPELGTLNLSKGGSYPVEYALRLGAGFGSQISTTLLRWVKTKNSVRPTPNALGFRNRVVDQDTWTTWLQRVAGYPNADLEVVHRTLRVREQPAAVHVAESTTQQILASQVRRETEAPIPVVAQGVGSPVGEVQVLQSKTAAEEKREPVAVAESPSKPSDPVREKILALVAEKTGYPMDMLALDLDMEADLGIDTVKQAEMFAAIRETYKIPRDENRKLRDYPTLDHVIRFVYEKRPDLAAPLGTLTPATATQSEPAASVSARQESPRPTISDDAVKDRILALVVEKTGYPQDMLDLDLDLEADLGIDTVKQAEMFAAIREIYDIPRDENRKLRDYPTLAHVMRFVYEKRPDLAVSSAPPEAEVTAGTSVSPVVVPVTSVAVSTPAESHDEITNTILGIVAEKTGYPQDMLDLDLDLEADLGIDTVKQAEMFAAVRSAYRIPRDETLKLRDFPTLAHVIEFARRERQRFRRLLPSPLNFD